MPAPSRRGWLPVQAAPQLTITITSRSSPLRSSPPSRAMGSESKAISNEKIGFKIREAETQNSVHAGGGRQGSRAAWWRFTQRHQPWGPCRSNSSWNSFARTQINHYAAQQPTHKRGDLSSLNYVNREIRIREVRVIGPDGEQLGMRRP